MQVLNEMKTNQSIRFLLIKIWSHLSRRRRLQLLVLINLMLLSGLAEMLSLGAVLPFLAVLSDPEILWQHHLIRTYAYYIGITASDQLWLPSAIIFAVAALSAALIRLSNVWFNGRLAAAIGSDLSNEAYRRTLYQPYEIHLQRNSAEVISATTSQINLTVAALNSFLLLITSSIVVSGLLIGLFLIDSQVAFSAIVLFGGAYLLLAITSKRELRSNGEKINKATTQQLKAVQEGLGAIRNVLLNNTQAIYLQIYRQADRPQRQLRAKNEFLSIFPRYSLEALGMVAISFLGGILILQRGSGASVVPLLGAMALGAQRLLPALQQIYNGWASLKSFNSAINSVVMLLEQPLPQISDTVKPFGFKKNIYLKNIHFRYAANQSEVIKGLDLKINAGERIGVIGSTGSGKSTVIDIMMGLLKPTYGRILVDGQNLHDDQDPGILTSWRNAIAIVPQSIYLADSSIAENIAFGIPRELIDFNRVREVASQAQISSFIETLPNRYDHFVGEQGIRLSGGQRQRIGIARALYKNSSILVLDEATSALDSQTENSIMHSIDKLSSKLTILIIAHRLSTIQSCDRVIQIENGLLVDQGPPIKFNQL